MSFWEINFVLSYVFAFLLLINFPSTLLSILPSNLNLGNINTVGLYNTAAVLLVYSLFCAMLPIARRYREKKIEDYKKSIEPDSQSHFYGFRSDQTFMFFRFRIVLIVYTIPVSLLLIRSDLIAIYLTYFPTSMASPLSSVVVRFFIYIILSMSIIAVVHYLLSLLTVLLASFFSDPVI